MPRVQDCLLSASTQLRLVPSMVNDLHVQSSMQAQRPLASEFSKSLTLIASLTAQTSPIAAPCVLHQLIADFHTFTPSNKGPSLPCSRLAQGERGRGASQVTPLLPLSVYAHACVCASSGAASRAPMSLSGSPRTVWPDVKRTFGNYGIQQIGITQVSH